MTTKEKIALHSLRQKVERGIYTEEKAKAEFERITGRIADEVPAKNDEDGQVMGEYLDSLNAALEKAAQVKEEEQQEGSTVDLNPLTDKMVQKRPAAKVVKVKKAS